MVNTIADCAKYLKEVSVLFFPILSSMSSDAFRDFRKYTEGASAIQSKNYKRIESICRKPDIERLNSIAYKSVMEVHDHILIDDSNLNAAFNQAKNIGLYPKDELNRIDVAMKSLGQSITRWRKAHYGIAVKMLGEATGTGYTEGTPYLKKVIDVPVF